MEKPLTKIARTAVVRAIIDRTPIGAEMTPEDLATFNEMCGTSWPAAKHMRNPKYPDPRHVHALKPEGWEQFSWNRAISPASRDKVDKAMRAEVQDQADEYLANSGEECELADETCDDVLTADHSTRNGGMMFKEIKQAFIAERGIPELKKGEAGGSDMIASIDVAAAWIAYHAQRVVWRVLCRSHNARLNSRKLQQAKEQDQDQDQ